MLKKVLSVFVLLALTLLALGAAAEQTVTDMYGREVTLDEPVERVVALTAADCEILCALGCEHMLVGRGTYCDYPQSILDVPIVASGDETNAEQIIALAPQLVLMADMAQGEEQIGQLEQVGVKTLVSDANDIAGVYAAIRMIAAAVDRDEAGEALIADMQKTFDGIAAASAHEGKTVYFEVSPLQYGLWAAGKHTFMDELAEMCGLTNAFADVDGWAQISQEQVLARDPDYIVTTTLYTGEGPTPQEEIASRPGWQNLKAIASHHVMNADSNAITRPGPRLKDAALELFHMVSAENALDSAETITDLAMSAMTEIYSFDPDVAKGFRYEIVSAEDPVTVNVYPFEDMDDCFSIVYDAEGFTQQITIPDILNFKTLGGEETVFDFWGMDDEQRAAYSKEYIPKVEALLRLDPDFYEDGFPSSIAEKARWHYDTTRRVYGLPEEGDLTKEEGYEKALQALQTQCAVALTPQGEYKVNYVDSLFDVTDPDQRFWQYNFDLLSEGNDSNGGYYIVSINAQTGEVVEAFAFTDDMPTATYY